MENCLSRKEELKNELEELSYKLKHEKVFIYRERQSLDDFFNESDLWKKLLVFMEMAGEVSENKKQQLVRLNDIRYLCTSGLCSLREVKEWHIDLDSCTKPKNSSLEYWALAVISLCKSAVEFRDIIEKATEDKKFKSKENLARTFWQANYIGNKRFGYVLNLEPCPESPSQIVAQKRNFPGELYVWMRCLTNRFSVPSIMLILDLYKDDERIDLAEIIDQQKCVYENTESSRGKDYVDHVENLVEDLLKAACKRHSPEILTPIKDVLNDVLNETPHKGYFDYILKRAKNYINKREKQIEEMNKYSTEKDAIIIEAIQKTCLGSNGLIKHKYCWHGVMKALGIDVNTLISYINLSKEKEMNSKEKQDIKNSIKNATQGGSLFMSSAKYEEWERIYKTGDDLEKTIEDVSKEGKVIIAGNETKAFHLITTAVKFREIFERCKNRKMITHK